MKYRSLNELMQDKNVTPEDVAQFALFERNLNDSDKFKAICDLILCCEKVSTLKLEARNKELEEALKSSLWVAKYYDCGKFNHMTGKAEQVLNNK